MPGLPRLRAGRSAALPCGRQRRSGRMHASGKPDVHQLPRPRQRERGEFARVRGACHPSTKLQILTQLLRQASSRGSEALAILERERARLVPLLPRLLQVLNLLALLVKKYEY